MKEDLEYFKSKEFGLILKKYEESVKSGHRIYMDADDLADIADYYQYKGQSEDADAAIALALEYNPNAVGPLLYKAREALMKKDFKTAREYANQIAAVDSQEALYLKGEMMICEGNPTGADLYFQEQMKNITSDELTDYIYDVANIFSDYTLHKQAFQWMLRSKGDDSEEFKELMARTLFGLEKYQDSEKIFNELIDNNPYSAHYWNALASSQYMQEDYGAAITSSEYAIAIDPKDPESLLSKANCLYNIGDFESALTYYQRYSEQVKDDEFGYLYQGTCLINLGKCQEAVTILESILPKVPQGSQYLPEIYQELAFGYSDLHKPDTALYYLDQTANLDCDHVNIEIIKGHILLSNKRFDEAQEMFKNALNISKGSPKTFFRIIVSLYDNQYVSTAYIMLKHFLQPMPEDWNDGYSYMALCCLDLGKEEEFLQYLKKAVEKNPQEAKLVLKDIFPEGTEPKDYYQYMLNQFDKNV